MPRPGVWVLGLWIGVQGLGFRVQGGGFTEAWLFHVRPRTRSTRVGLNPSTFRKWPRPHNTKTATFGAVASQKLQRLDCSRPRIATFGADVIPKRGHFVGAPRGKALELPHILAPRARTVSYVVPEQGADD